ncbi:hypothetical protein GCM10011444_03400 [Winogradskyella haliclonae]|uniref:P/Homo B domain-containing protein n=2 Tax=Winogradskyella haliclonae TaxID=2048558 RepID=A0ABQ2BU83_9FLAO|nr:hypothetical protein GCM10011444_03400 [Winogradskyella haliclonae]
MQDPAYQERMNQLENFTQQGIANNSFRMMDDIIYVPVVVHVVWNSANPVENISDAQIESQIDVIYKDFRALNDEFADIQANIWPQAGDTKIEYYLAQIDPDGNPTNGITRKETNVAAWGTDDSIKFSAQGGTDAWDPLRYFNFWVGNIGGGILGYATFPASAGDPDDGIVMSPQFFGSSDYEAAAGETFFLDDTYDLGRTTTHEIGHYFNLRHIWGDGGCGVDDFVDDTPSSDSPNYPCAGARPVKCGTDDMFENYMDYSDDACMGLFTQGQIDRMRAVFEPGGPREVLNQSPFPFEITFADSNASNVEVCKPADATYNFTYNLIDPTFTGSVTFATNGLPMGATASFSPSTVTADATPVTMTVSGLASVDVGTYDFQIETTDGTDTAPTNATLNVFDDTFGTITQGYPNGGITGVPPMAEFTWSEDSNAAAYEVDVASDAGFTNIVSSGVVTEALFVPMGLATDTSYFWRVRAVNNCGEGAYASTSFQTGTIECNVSTATDTPIAIPDGIFFVGPGDPVSSTLQVTDVSEITDVNVTINVSHTWGDDLLITLTSPSGTDVILSNRNGGNGTQYVDTVFDSDATDPISSGSGDFTGTFTPDGDLSTLNGEIASGDWLLTVQDFVSGDTGNIENWSLEICGVPLPDSDDDLVPDSLDNCPLTANTDQSDVDGDGLGDVCDDDIDNDGLLNDDDNCPSTANADQEDLDGNGIGDVCDVTCTIATYAGESLVIDDDSALPSQQYVISVDIEEDLTITDVNVTVDIQHTWTGDLLIALFNPTATEFVVLADGAGGGSENFTNTVFDDDGIDTDGDGIVDIQPVSINDGVAPFTGVFAPEEPLSFFNGQQSIGTWFLVVVDQDPSLDGGSLDGFSLEICGIRDSEDFDSDGILNDDDNCVIVDNTDQADNDGDGIGDECDDDDDNDGVLDVNDNCQFTANTDQADNDGDGLGDVCDDDDDNDGELDINDNCPLTANADQSDVDGDGLGDVCDDITVNDIVTPNGDNVNDTWQIQSIELYPGTTVRVYDRTGNEVFASNSYRNDWGATNQSGKALPSGSYYYVVNQSGEGNIVVNGWLFVTY